MFNLPFFVGLDYHQKIVQVCVNQQGFESGLFFPRFRLYCGRFS